MRYSIFFSFALILMSGQCTRNRCTKNSKGTVDTHHKSVSGDYAANQTSSQRNGSGLVNKKPHAEALLNECSTSVVGTNHKSVSGDHAANPMSNQRNGSGLANKKPRHEALFNECFASLPQHEAHFDLFERYALTVSTIHSPKKRFEIPLPDKGTVAVDRAGILVISIYNGAKYAILGEDKYSVPNPFSSWFSGACEARDQNYMATIIREGFEESAGMLALTESEVQKIIDKKYFFMEPPSARTKILKEYWLSFT